MWDDVRFDHEAAAELRRQLAATALAIEAARVAVEGEADVASQGWRGSYHLDFVAERSAWSAIAGQLVASIEATITAVAAAAEAALVEQAARVALRDRLVAAGSVVDPAGAGG